MTDKTGNLVQKLGVIEKNYELGAVSILECDCCNGISYQHSKIKVCSFYPIGDPYTNLCVHEVKGKLQLTIRSYHVGLSISFPAMDKEELLDCWFLDCIWLPDIAKNLFNTAILRLIPSFITRNELYLHRNSMRVRQPSIPACLL
ncbi:hypothetical protein P364_0131895 [Paenibacillus sp. MAEPY2]|nr:hypothetical protein P364_0131895 [Paenibacillus sp. MAEPY2]KGP78700.1 hypothetical protein P363_0132025 [Paenibacillus sp. MAEPY1]OZQ61318.1 hypothetical protein CA599_28440 [Paenibacillus taichungensis]